MIRYRVVFGFEVKALRGGNPFVRRWPNLPFRTGASNCWGSGKTVRAQCQKRRKSLYLRAVGNRWSRKWLLESNLLFRGDHLRKEPKLLCAHPKSVAAA